MFGCQLATNGGFFDMTWPKCEGDAIVNGSTVIWEGTGTGTKDLVVLGLIPSRKATAIGYVSPSTYKSYGFHSLLSGRGWLVRDGVDYANKSHEFENNVTAAFITEKAPRTAVGVTGDGSLLILVVDGVEVLGLGVDLHEMAGILISQGAMHAINIDGGGSSDAVLDYKVWSRPTCQDQPEPICERPVTTITCVRYPG